MFGNVYRANPQSSAGAIPSLNISQGRRRAACPTPLVRRYSSVEAFHVAFKTVAGRLIVQDAESGANHDTIFGDWFRRIWRRPESSRRCLLLHSWSFRPVALRHRWRHVWAVNDGEKVERDDLDNPNKTANSAWDGHKIKIFGARNEIIAFQLIVEAGSRRHISS